MSIRNLLLTIGCLSFVLGMRMCGYGGGRDRVKSKLMDVCSNEVSCVSALENHFSDCYTHSYSRYSSDRVDKRKLANCLNQRSGESFFAVADRPSH
jgi:hypothetical protein